MLVFKIPVLVCKLNINPSIPHSYFFPLVYCIYIIWILNHFLKIQVHIFHAFYNCTSTYHSMKTCTCLVKIKEMQALYRYFNTKRVAVFRKVQHYNFQNQFFLSLCDRDWEKRWRERESSYLPITFFITIWFSCHRTLNVPQRECPEGIGWLSTHPPQAYW